MYMCRSDNFQFYCLLSLTLFSGVVLITLALCADAVIGNVQEKALKAYSASNVEMVSYMHFHWYHTSYDYAFVGVFYFI